jgi:hypothetical protein
MPACRCVEALLTSMPPRRSRMTACSSKATHSPAALTRHHGSSLPLLCSPASVPRPGRPGQASIIKPVRRLPPRAAAGGRDRRAGPSPAHPGPQLAPAGVVPENASPGPRSPSRNTEQVAYSSRPPGASNGQSALSSALLPGRHCLDILWTAQQLDVRMAAHHAAARARRIEQDSIVRPCRPTMRTDRGRRRPAPAPPGPSRARFARTCSSRPGARSSAVSAMPGQRSSRWQALPPGAAQASSTRIPGAGSEQTGRQLGGGILDRNLAGSEARQRCTTSMGAARQQRVRGRQPGRRGSAGGHQALAARHRGVMRRRLTRSHIGACCVGRGDDALPVLRPVRGQGIQPPAWMRVHHLGQRARPAPSGRRARAASAAGRH